MNRITSYLPQTSSNQVHPHYRPTRRLAEDSETTLRDMAYVLSLTRRIRDEIVESVASGER